jgi:phosphoribosylformylglycinamidine cyclo-ligase
MAAGKRKQSAYAQAGVDIDEMMQGLDAIKRMVKATSTPGVLSRIGSFGGLFRSPGRDSILVSSTDGVGTKLKVALMAGRHTTVGQDLVNHCVNDILVQGAEPWFLRDYHGTSHLRASTFRDVVSGLCKACRENGCALLGGETAEMPGLYPKGEYDLVGTIVGSVRQRDLVTGDAIRHGDVLIGLPSTGLHTNGFSLARKVVFDMAGLAVDDLFPGTRRSVADVLLAVHRSYLRPVKALRQTVRVRGMAHITGGGLVDNVPRVLPENSTAVIDRSAWKVPALFSFLQETGKVDRDEMYRVFNMGIGFVLIVRRADADAALAALRKHRTGAIPIGCIEKGPRGVKLLN